MSPVVLTFLISAFVFTAFGFMLCAMLSINRDDDEARFIVESEKERWADVNTVFDRFEKLLREHRRPGHADLRFALALLGRSTGRVPDVPAIHGEVRHDC
jgi:hypothetical protein